MSASAGYKGALLDTSVWVAVMEDAAVADELEAAQGDLPTLTSPLVLAELASLGTRGRFDVAEKIEQVRGRARLEDLSAEDAVEAGLLHGRLRAAGHEKVGLGDCLIYATAQRVGALLITCDTDLAKQKGVVVLSARSPTKRRSR